MFVSIAFYATGLNANTSKGLFTLSDSVTVTNVKNGIMPITVPVKKIKVPPVNITVTVTNSWGVNRPYATQVFAAAAISVRVQKYYENEFSFCEECSEGFWKLGLFHVLVIFFWSRSYHIIVAL